MREYAQKAGYEFHVIHPSLFSTVSAPKYPEIRLALCQKSKVHRALDKLSPDAVHIATEGPLGLDGRSWCRKRGKPFSTSYHTRFPEYIEMFFGVPAPLSYSYLKWFHRDSGGVLVPTKSVSEELVEKGFRNVKTWTRGVDGSLFIPRDEDKFELERPVWAYVGRVSVEKNLDEFLSLDLEGTKLVVGDGPYLGELKGKYPDAVFPGYMKGEQLAHYFASADVFVFPSVTDTFGVVMIEAMSCGVPVAAHPVPGPKDVVLHGKTGCLSFDLAEACREAIKCSPEACMEHARSFTWENTARMFIENLALPPGTVSRPA